ncbi:MAG: bifunctional DNA-formamidopyrimidine glycosylase/DNA-(apurinic or apyrimidinic site) lyase [Lentisphaeria bacterium]|nr:bifunctional DNA-formamidopyrimidine glycosylase/DNA-(apurinic or apyrimidinic site) lyase [Lentisphaeria bacterium]
MPELPEAENIGNALKRVLPGKTITGIEIFSPAMRSSLEPLKTAGLEGKSFLDIRRRGRYLIADLSDGRGLLMHFGMSGVVRVEPASVPRRKHEHVFIHLSDGKVFRFECTRRFSLLEVHTLSAPGRMPEKLSNLGPEPFSQDFNSRDLLQKASGKTTPVKTFIMDNSVVTGIGNIYAAETLFAARIHPLRPAKTLSADEWNLIISNARSILKKAIAAGGSSISDFLNVDGSEGKFAQELKVYAQTGSPCPVCGTLIECIKTGGRSSFFCPECQK